MDCSLSESSFVESDYILTASSEYSDSELSYDEDNTELEPQQIHDLQHIEKNMSDASEELDSTDKEDNSGEEKVTESQVTVKRCVSGGQKRKWDKRNYCIYCKKTQSKIARHLKRTHSKEKEVALAMSYPPSSKQSRQMFEALRRKGNYYHNIEVLKEGKGEIVTNRRPTEHVDPENYLPCPKCFGFFMRNELWKHERRCANKIGEPIVESKRKRRIQSAASSLLPCRGQALQRCAEIVSRMFIDQVSHEVKSDPLICEFGVRLLEKYSSGRSKDAHVSQKMRELGRFVLSAKSINPKVKMLQDVLVPPHFKLAVQAAKQASGFMSAKYKYDPPSLAIKLGQSLKAACNIVIAQYVKAEDEVAASRVRNFSNLLDDEWHLYVSCRTQINLDEDSWNKKDMIPLTQDVMELNSVLKAKIESAKKELLDGPNPSAYSTLSECLLSAITLFNRRRQCEVAKIPLFTYMNRVKQKPNDDIMACLSKLEQSLSTELTRLVIRVKKAIKVPVLLTKEMTKSVDFLVMHRNEDNDILDQNGYVFARQNSKSHLRGSDCLRKYAAVCGAKRPEMLTSTHLRNHVATISQVINLKDNELQCLANFMGHDIHIHREYYRLTENTLELAKMSKLLMAIESGTHIYDGMSLDEIDLSLQVQPDAQVSDVCDFNEDSIDVPQSEYEAAFLTQETGLSRMQTERSPEPVQASDDRPTSSSWSMEMYRKRKMETDWIEEKESNKRSKSTSQPVEDSDDILTERPVQFRTIQETDLDSQSPPQKSRHRPWSSQEKEAVWRQLGEFISQLRVPGKEACEKALNAEQVLSRRNWKDIKNQVHNTVTTLKRKQQ
ncbi:uncharacterized protein LOC128766343 [Synchiropus splendidus]|uniref:uncharacterized protein LOC128766343 n=1 Tax=Synchiropus splendidus TaxID=270530 RepID=UPI00237E4670|nr:uncharacterized protein LOC128766343 [Synchiropus splendidus]